MAAKEDLAPFSKRNNEEIVTVDFYQRDQNNSTATTGGTLETAVEIDVEEGMGFSVWGWFWHCIRCSSRGGTKFEKVRLGDVQFDSLGTPIVQNTIHGRDDLRRDSNTKGERSQRISKTISESLKKGAKTGE